MTVVARNALLLTAEKASHLVGALFAMFLVARYLGSDVLADYGFVISVTSFLVPLVDVGLNTRVIKASAARDRSARSSFTDAIAYRLAVGPAVLGLMMVGGLLWARTPEAELAVLLIGLSTFAMSLGDTANAVFKGLQRADYSFGLIGGLNLILLTALLMALERGGGLVAVGVAYLMARTAYLLAAFGLVYQRAGVSIRGAKPSLRVSVVVEGLYHLPSPYFLGNALAAAYLATYVILGEGDAGPYYIGYRAAAAVFILVSAGFEAVLASASAHGADRSLNRSVGSMFVLLAIGGAVGLYACAPLVRVLFGEVYVQSVTSVRVLAWCIPPFAFTGLAHTLLIAQDAQKQATHLLLLFLAATTGLSVVTAFLLGPLTTASVPMLVCVLVAFPFWFRLRQLRTRWASP